MKRRRRAAPRNETSTVDEAQRRVAQDGDLDEDTRRHILAFMSYLQVEGLKPDSIAGYATTLRRLASICPGNEFLYLEREDVQEVILALQGEGYRTSTMNLFRSQFLRFQRWLRQEHGYLRASVRKRHGRSHSCGARGRAARIVEGPRPSATVPVLRRDQLRWSEAVPPLQEAAGQRDHRT